MAFSSGIVLVINTEEDKFSFLISLTEDITKAGYNAGRLAKGFAGLVGGSGGGQPDFAQGGGKDISKIDPAVSQLSKIIIKG